MVDSEEIKNEVAEIRDDLMKHRWSRLLKDIKRLIVSAVGIGILGLGGYSLFSVALVDLNVFESSSFAFDKSQKQAQQQNQSSVQTVNNEIVGAEAVNTTSVVKITDDNWVIEQGISREEGYYCVKKRRGFEISSISLKNDLVIGQTLSLRLLVKKDMDAIVEQSKKIVITYGDKEYSYRLFYPDSDPQRILFEENLGGDKKLTHEKLRYPILQSDKDEEVELQLLVSSLKTNEAIFKTRVIYIPVRNDTDKRLQVPDNFHFSTLLPWPNSDNTLAKTLSIGSYEGVCFKVLNASLVNGEVF